MQPEVFIYGVPHYDYDYITSLYLCQEVFQKYLIYFLAEISISLNTFALPTAPHPRLWGGRTRTCDTKFPNFKKDDIGQPP